MSGMFSDNLKELDLNNFDIKKVKNMSYMFEKCVFG